MTEFSPILLIHFTIILTKKTVRHLLCIVTCSLIVTCVRELSIIEENNERIEHKSERKY